VRVNISPNNYSAHAVSIRLRLDEAELLVEELQDIEPDDLGPIERELAARISEKLESLKAFLEPPP
jgi:hypothetical protein